ncbi:MAG: hypothetical protein ABIF45_17345 [Pseudomonadota bacterium]
MLTAFISSQNAAGLGRPFIARHRLVEYDFNRAVKWASSYADPHCYSGGSPVANGAVVRNLAEVFSERNSPVPAGDMVIGAGQTVTHSGGAIDFSAVSAHGSYERGPATPAAAIWANGQYFLSMTCLTLPTTADWPEGPVVAPIQAWTAGNNGYAANLDIATTGMTKFAGSPGFAVLRQHGGAFATNSTYLLVPTAALGGFAQVATWCIPGELGMSLTTSLGVVEADPVAPTANNSTNFSALRPLRGIMSNLWTAEIANNGQRWKLHSSFDDAIGLDGRALRTLIAENWGVEKAMKDAGIYS